jgi:hypothetical protein
MAKRSTVFFSLSLFSLQNKPKKPKSPTLGLEPGFFRVEVEYPKRLDSMGK